MGTPPPATIYDDICSAAANWYGVDVGIVRAICMVESSFNPAAKAKTTSATGMMQLTRAAAMDMGVDEKALPDAFLNIAAGTKYLAKMIQAFDAADGIRAYYAGPGNIRMKREADASAQGYYGDLAARLKEADTYLAKVMNYLPDNIAAQVAASDGWMRERA